MTVYAQPNTPGAVIDFEAQYESGLWTRNQQAVYRMARGIEAGRVWVNHFHPYPAHAAFGGYKGSGIGRETHKMMLEHYQQTKNMLVSYKPEADGFF